jgi:hypothetical protein
MTGGRSKSTGIAVLAVMVVVLVGAAAAQAGQARLKVGSTLAGVVITNTSGYALMMFPKEGHTLNRCIRIKTCMSDWPPVTTTGRPLAGPGIDPKLVGTIPYRGRLREVTYAGWPLHRYKFAYSAQSSVLDIGIRQFGGNWYALAPNGKIVK